ncbi:MAG: VOC family protein [Bacteroidota bacterium]
MATQIFVNLPIKDLGKTTAFFGHLGFTFDQKFTNDKATCMIIGENIYAMLLVEEFFKTFTSKEICDAHTTTEAIICFSADSREKVDEMAAKAIEAGGTNPGGAQDHGWMYIRSFQDLDGHLWEVMHTDLSLLPAEMQTGN